jgi:hypothetical protein
MADFPLISDLIDSDRYQKVLEEISRAIDSAVQSTPYDEPQLCQNLEDAVARPLLEKETESNEEKFNEVFQVYQEIIEDVLCSLLELRPLEQRRDEILKRGAQSMFTKLLERYDISQREEAGLIARYRDQLDEDPDPSVNLQAAVYEIEGENRKLKKELRTLESQLRRTALELDQEREVVVDEIDENDPMILRGRKMEEQLAEATEQVGEARARKAQYEQECLALQQEIDAMTAELVAMNRRSVSAKKKAGRSQK